MTQPRVIRSPQAKLDLVEQAVWIAADNLDAAERFLTAAERAFEELASLPSVGRERRFRSPELAGVRSLPIPGFENWLIFYRPMDVGIQVIRVLHGARDIDSIFDD